MTGAEIDAAVAAGKLTPNQGSLAKQAYGIPEDLGGANDPMPTGPIEDLSPPSPVTSGTIDASAAGLAKPVGGTLGDDNVGDIFDSGIAPGVMNDPNDGPRGPSGDLLSPKPAPGADLTGPIIAKPTGYSDATKAWLANPANAGTIAAMQGKNGPLVASSKPDAAASAGMGIAKPWEPFTEAEKRYFADQIAFMKQNGATDQQISDAVVSGKMKQAALMNEATTKAEQMQAAAEAREVERQNYVRSALATQEAEADALAKTEIDPGRFWAEKDTGTKLVMGIALFLGGLKNGNNDAMDLMQSQINRDIDAQKANLQGKYAAFTANKGIYAARMDAFKDERIAEASTQASSWQWVNQKAQALAMSTDSEIAQAAYQKAADAAAFKVREFTDKIALEADQRFAARQKAMAMAQAAEAAEIKKQNTKMFDASVAIVTKRAEEMGGYPGIDAKGMPVVVDQNGAVIWTGTKDAAGGGSATIFGAPNANGAVPVAGNAPAKSKEAAAKLDELGQNYANAMRLLTDMENHVDNVGTTYNPWGNNAATSDALQAELFGSIKGMAAAKGGSPGSSENDAKILMKRVPSPGAFFSGDAKATIQKLKADLANEYENGKKALLAPNAQPATLNLQKPPP